ncbi:hypothetical protein CC79DRAFT_1332181 [Sarocladium strictum]
MILVNLSPAGDAASNTKQRATTQERKSMVKRKRSRSNATSRRERAKAERKEWESLPRLSRNPTAIPASNLPSPRAPTITSPSIIHLQRQTDPASRGPLSDPYKVQTIRPPKCHPCSVGTRHNLQGMPSLWSRPPLAARALSLVTSFDAIGHYETPPVPPLGHERECNWRALPSQPVLSLCPTAGSSHCIPPLAVFRQVLQVCKSR